MCYNECDNILSFVWRKVAGVTALCFVAIFDGVINHIKNTVEGDDEKDYYVCFGVVDAVLRYFFCDSHEYRRKLWKRDRIPRL